ncbi:VOC family protein [Lysinibacillus xylanilyticus]|uniref:VOC family protein n=1 Tax=Lysinibacillus xylanilyticus TaxID=582475 RepID=UPI002B248FEC|nr:VOC family protein [Lysinibacillus xylanilyticus]MEB2299271.1 VOC family protein [Lysinibacillus xylanilyticus]
MSLYFDHLVHQVQSPENTKIFLNKRNIHTVNGGQHTMWGTYNTLSYFGLNYIEQIAIYDRHLFENAVKLPYSLHYTFKHTNERYGFSRIALRTKNIKEEGQRLRALGFEVFGPDACSRTRPDGSVVEWKLLHFGKPGQEIDFPFLIEWADTDEERTAQLKANGAIKTNQSISMESVQFYVKDVQATVKQWREVLQLPESEQQEQFTSLQLPNIRLDFYDEVTAATMALGHLNEGPFGVTLRDTDRTKETLVFPGAFYWINS